MSYALTRYTADGVTLSFTVGFTYRDADDVIVKVDGVLQTFPTDYALTSGGSQVSFPSAPANGAAIFITRSTSQSVRLTDYTAGAVFKESDLDTDSIQAFNMSQEAIDIAKDSIAKDALGDFDAQGLRIKNVADPINDQDAANKNHVKLALADFKAKYYGASATAPESPIEGGLWWDSVNDIMKVYQGSAWISVNSVVNGTSNRSVYTVGTPQDYYTGSTTVFHSAYDVGYVDVYLNGAKLVVGTDFTATDGSTLVLTSPASVGDTVEIIGFGVFNIAPNVVTVDAFTGDGTTTTFVMSDIVNDPLMLQVFIDGLSQSMAAYTVSSTSLIFSSPPPINAEIEVRRTAAATLVSSVFSVNEYTGDGSTLAFTLNSPAIANNTSVHINGVYQYKSTYNITGTTITFSGPPPVGSAIEIVIQPDVLATQVTDFIHEIDEFTGDGTTKEFNISSSGVSNNLSIHLDGVYQHKSTYNVIGTTLTFTSAPPASSAIEVLNQFAGSV